MSTTQNRLTCMNCGKPITAGFFCPQCEQMATGEGDSKSSPAGSRFTGRAGAQRKKQVLVEDVTRLLKTVVILALIVGGGFLGWSIFGDRIMAAVRGAQSIDDKERYDPTRDAQIAEEGEAAQRRRTFGAESVESAPPATE